MENDRSSECDSDDNCGDGTAVYEEDLHTSAVADDATSLYLGQENTKRRGPKRGDHKSRVNRSREHHAHQWCEFCNKGSHDTHGCRCLRNIWEGLPPWKLPWDEFLHRPELWNEYDDSRPETNHPSPSPHLMVAKPKWHTTKPPAVAASTSIPRKVAMLDSGADGSERAAATTAALAGRTTFREKQPVSYTHLTLPTTPYV